MALPNHVEDTVNAIAQLHARHDARATRAQKMVEAATASAGSGERPFDPLPFQWLELILTLVALLLAILILSTQRRADALADSRERMTLEAVLTTDQKTSKIVQLLEELRRDTPAVPDRVDQEAHDMSTKVSPDAVLGALEDEKPDAPVTPKAKS